MTDDERAEAVAETREKIRSLRESVEAAHVVKAQVPGAAAEADRLVAIFEHHAAAQEAKLGALLGRAEQ